MPIGNQSLQSWISTIYTSMVASTYKANIDSDLSIASNTAGALYVIPNNPAGLSVLVDPAFNLPQIGAASPYLFNGAASPIPVTLTAPGSNSYYACIYWDLTTNTAGVVYGATGVSPTPVIPDQTWRVPLAQVLLTTGQVTVTASNISDVRSWVPEPPFSSFNTGISATSLTVNCQGAAAVMVFLNFTGAGMTITFSNLRIGVPINLYFENANASTQTIKMAATTPSGAAYTSILSKFGGAVVNMITTGVSPAASNHIAFSGASATGPGLFLQGT
jgi:hypothetical protein